MSEVDRMHLSRRAFVSYGVRGMVLLPAAAALGGLAGCGGSEEEPAPTGTRPGGSAAPAREPEPRSSAPTGGSAPSPGAASPDALVTGIAAMKPTVEALQYVNESSKPDQRCSNCQFYTAKDEAVGKCQLFPQGLVRSEGWCASWAKKVT